MLALVESDTSRRQGVVADVGCDHAQLALALLHKRVCSKVVAVDCCQAPLKVGKANAQRLYDLGVLPTSPRPIEFRLGDGLSPLDVSDGITTLCIAGLGARSIIDILRGSGCETDTLRSLGIERIVLQPVDPRPHLMIPLRRWLQQHSWSIDDETIIEEGGRHYLTVLAHSSPSNHLCVENGESALIFSENIRRRIRATVERAQSGQRSIEETTVSSEEQEFRMWQDYVFKQLELLRSKARHDTYDIASGMAPGTVAAALRSENDFLVNAQI